jgi:hypothetical protein
MKYQDLNLDGVSLRVPLGWVAISLISFKEVRIFAENFPYYKKLA